MGDYLREGKMTEAFQAAKESVTSVFSNDQGEEEESKATTPKSQPDTSTAQKDQQNKPNTQKNEQGHSGTQEHNSTSHAVHQQGSATSNDDQHTMTKREADIEKAKVMDRLERLKDDEYNSLSTGLQNNMKVKDKFMYHDSAHVACQSKANG